MSGGHGNFQSCLSPWQWQWCSRLTCLTSAQKVHAVGSRSLIQIFTCPNLHYPKHYHCCAINHKYYPLYICFTHQQFGPNMFNNWLPITVLITSIWECGLKVLIICLCVCSIDHMTGCTCYTSCKPQRTAHWVQTRDQIATATYRCTTKPQCNKWKIIWSNL